MTRLRERLKGHIRQLVKEIWVLVYQPESIVRCADVQVHFHGGGVRQFVAYHWQKPTTKEARGAAQWRDAKVQKKDDLSRYDEKRYKPMFGFMMKLAAVRVE